MRKCLAVLLILSLPAVVIAQVGTTVVKDSASARQARVLAATPAATDNGLVVRPISSAGVGLQDVNLLQLNGNVVSVGNGIANTGVLRVAIVSDNTAFTVNATQSGTWTVQPGNTANTTPWLASISQGGNTATVTAGFRLSVDGSGVTQPVSGTFWQATQPVSGTFWQATQPVSGTFWQATQPISGTVTATQATATNLRIAGGDAAGTPTAGTVLAVQGIASGTALPVSGTFWQATQPISGTVTANAGTGTFVVGDGAGALNTIVDSGTLTAVTTVTNPVTVTDGAGAMNVIVDSGTLTAVTSITNAVTSVGAAADGIAVSGNPVRIAGKDGGGLTQDIITDASGELQVDVLTLPSVTVGTFPDNEPFNLAQVGGTAVVTGGVAGSVGVGGLAASGAAVAGNPVLIAGKTNGNTQTISAESGGILPATNSNLVPTDAEANTNFSHAVDEADSAGGQIVAPMVFNGTTWDRSRGNTGGTFVQGPIADGSAIGGNPERIGGTDGTNIRTFFVDPCQREARTTFSVDIVTATTTVITTATAGQRVYICSLVLFSAGTNNVALVEGTGGTCGTGTAGMAGGATAGEGFNLTAQTGVAHGSGHAYVFATAGTNVDVCLITSAAVQLSGTITWVKEP